MLAHAHDWIRPAPNLFNTIFRNCRGNELTTDRLNPVIRMWTFLWNVWRDTFVTLFFFFILSCYCLFLFSFLFAQTLPIQECWLVDDTRPWLFQIIRYSLLLRDKIQFIYSFLFSYFINRRLVNYHKILIRCSQKKEDLGRDNVCS